MFTVDDLMQAYRTRPSHDLLRSPQFVPLTRNGQLVYACFTAKQVSVNNRPMINVVLTIPGTQIMVSILEEPAERKE